MSALGTWVKGFITMLVIFVVYSVLGSVGALADLLWIALVFGLGPYLVGLLGDCLFGGEEG